MTEYIDDPFTEEEIAKIERDAVFAAILATLCHAGAVMVCCVFPAGFASLAMGFGSLWLAKGVLDTGIDGAPRAYAYTSVVMSVIGILWSGFVTFCICAYFAFYFLMIVAMGAGNM